MRVNFSDADPILIAKAAPIETYWTQAQKPLSKRIILREVDGEGNGLKQIYTNIQSDGKMTASELIKKIDQDKKDLIHFEE